MKPEIKERWIAALTSGEYAQCAGALRKESAFIDETDPNLDEDDLPEFSHCCLGVLTDLCIKEMEMDWNYEEVIIHRDSTETLPRVVMEWAGLDNDNPVVSHDGFCTDLASLNDSGHSFREIATLIKEQL